MDQDSVFWNAMIKCLDLGVDVPDFDNEICLICDPSHVFRNCFKNLFEWVTGLVEKNKF
jgi:hypothetical protein